jgi:uncharacterized membrane protein
MDESLYGDLNRRLAEAERELAGIRRDLIAARPLGFAAVPRPIAPRPPRAPKPASAPERSFENLIAGRALQVVGLLLFLLGAAFYLKLAFDNNWIGPSGRVVLGIVAGSLFMYGGAAKIRPPYVYLAEGVIGLGAGLLYLSLWGAYSLFGLIPASVALLAMASVTCSLGAIAHGRSSERIALTGVFGGYVTPLLLAGGPTNHVALAIYLLALSAALIALASSREFSRARAAAVVATLLYAPAFFTDAAQGWTPASAVAAAAALFLELAVALFLTARRDGKPRITLTTLNVLTFVLALGADLQADSQGLGFALLALAAVLLGAVLLKPVAEPIRHAYAWMGLGCVTLALPALLHASTLADALSMEAGLLVALGARQRNARAAFAGMALFCVAFLVVVLWPFLEPWQTNHAFLANARLAAYAVYVAALAVALRVLRGAKLEPEDALTFLRRCGRIACNCAALIALTQEVNDLPLTLGWTQTDFILSAVWSVYAAVLFTLGLRKADALLRWQGLTLLGITIYKLFAVDLSSVEISYRIISFLGLGAVLVGLSTYYQRTMIRKESVPS